MKILIYALGGGWGHLTRAAALTRALPKSVRVEILANSPHIEMLKDLPIRSVATSEEAAEYVSRDDTDILVVDTFPRGLGGELADVLPRLRSRRVLIHRVLNPEYVEWANLRAFVAEHYACILCPGERGLLSDLPKAMFTPPWLIREPIDAAVDTNVVVIASGNRHELEWYGNTSASLSHHTQVRCVAADLPSSCPPDLWVRHWPAIDWIARAKAVVGGAGYNTVHECLALGVPLVARPWPRKYDLQQWRAEQHPSIVRVTTPKEACDAALVALGKPRRASTRTDIPNGARQAAALIASLL